MKRKDVLGLAIAVVLLILGTTLFIKTRVAVSQEKLAMNITTAINKQDTKLFLKQFDKNSKQSKYAEIGAKSVLKDWQKNASVSTTEVGNRVATNRRVPGMEYDYRFVSHHKRLLAVFDKYYLTAKLTIIAPDSMTLAAKTKLNGHLITNKTYKIGLFPGKYHYVSKLNGVTSGYYFYLTGDPKTMSLPFDSDANYDANEYTDSSTDESDRDSAYATMDESSESALKDRIGKKYDNVYGNEQKNYSSYDDSQYSSYEGNTIHTDN